MVFSTLGILVTVRANPEAWRDAFVYKSKLLTANMIQALYANIDYSPPGTNKANEEHTVMSWWQDFLIDTEGKHI